MIGFIRKMLYKAAAAALEKPGDETHYFLGFETKIDHRRAFDFLLKAFEMKSPGTESRFYRLVDEAAGMDNPGADVFKVAAAVSGTGFFAGLSDEAREYLLEKAYRRGMSLRDVKMKKEVFAIGLGIMRNSMFGFAWKNRRMPKKLPDGSVSVDRRGKITVMAGRKAVNMV